MDIQVTHGCQVSRATYAPSSLSFSPHPFLLSKIPHFSITCYFFIWSLMSMFRLLININCIQRIQNSCLRFSYCVGKYDHIFPYYQISGWFKIWQHFNLHLSYLYFLSFTPIFLYICVVSFNSEHLLFNPFVIIPKITHPSPYIVPLSSVWLSPISLSNILILFLINKNLFLLLLFHGLAYHSIT